MFKKLNVLKGDTAERKTFSIGYTNTEFETGKEWMMSLLIGMLHCKVPSKVESTVTEYSLNVF